MRYGLSEEKEDLDTSVLHFTEAILLPLLPMAGPASGLDVFELLFPLASAFIHRSKKSERLDDVQYALSTSVDSFDIPRKRSHRIIHRGIVPSRSAMHRGRNTAI
jgi:hypothetical protein